MIYYFSGTGNTETVAMKLCGEIGGFPQLITEISGYDVEFEGTDAVLLFPVYAWGVPPVMMDFIRDLPEKEIEKIRTGRTRAWCVATCGDETGMAVEMFREAFRKRGVEISGAWSVITPNVYVLLPGFDVDPKEIEERKLGNISARVREIGKIILNYKKGDAPVIDVHVGPWPRLKTGIVYPLFKRWGINWKKWRWNRECIGCGQCAEVCPVENIAMEGGHPRWGCDCVSCLGCYHVCPTHAIEYGKATVGKGQYKRIRKEELGIRN